MALRIREDGRILCAAMHPAEPGDTYLHDGISYRLTVELGAIVTEPMHCDGGRGGHAKHGEWWWANAVPGDVTASRLRGPCDGMSEVPFERVHKSAYGRYRLLWATDLIGETQRRGWIEAGLKVNTEHVRQHRETLGMEHEFRAPDREDTVDLALALMVARGLDHEQEPPVRRLLCMAYDESDRFG